MLNSFHLVKNYNGLHIDNHYELISLDVISLFTNIPIKLANDSVVCWWDEIKDNFCLLRNGFLLAVRFVLNSTFFTFNGKIYQQTFDTSMDSPLSPIIADMTMRDLERRAKKSSVLFAVLYVYVMLTMLLWLFLPSWKKRF